MKHQRKEDAGADGGSEHSPPGSCGCGAMSGLDGALMLLLLATTIRWPLRRRQATRH